MKKTLLIFIFIAPIFIFGQSYMPNLPYNNKTGYVEYYKSIKSKYPKLTLYKNAKKWSNTLYDDYDSKQVFENNYTTGEIYLKYQEMAVGENGYVFDCNLYIDISESIFKYKLKNIVLYRQFKDSAPYQLELLLSEYKSLLSRSINAFSKNENKSDSTKQIVLKTYNDSLNIMSIGCCT